NPRIIHTFADVAQPDAHAYRPGSRGVTYFRDGSRYGVLEHLEEKPAAEPAAQAGAVELGPVPKWTTDRSKGRPELLRGYTRQVVAPEGKVNLTLNSDDAGLFEVFISV